jgi:hypothetical protein
MTYAGHGASCLTRSPRQPRVLAVAYRAPRAIVRCVSAAAVYDLTDVMPPRVQIAVTTRDRPPRVSYPAAEVIRFGIDTFELGLSATEEVPDKRVRIYDPRADRDRPDATATPPEPGCTAIIATDGPTSRRRPRALVRSAQDAVAALPPLRFPS